MNPVKPLCSLPEAYCWTEHRKVLPAERSGVPALKIFGVTGSGCARQPLCAHYHPDCMEIVLLLKGIQVYEAGGERYTMTGGKIFVTMPDEVHSSGGDPQNICDMIWMQLDLRENIPFFGLDAQSAELLRKELRALPRMFAGSAALQSELYRAFISLVDEDALVRLSGRQRFVCALIDLVQLAHGPQQENCTESVARAVDYISRNIRGHIRLEDAAARCGLSVSRFHVLFCRAMGTTPREYINRCRIEEAKKLLDSGRSVTETAQELGFGTPNYLAVSFKKYTGLSPTEYRCRSCKT